MKQFSKTVLAAALFVAAGAANASIATGSATASEAFLSVYDKSQSLTFTLDLGLTISELINNVSNAAYVKSFDLDALTSAAVKYDVDGVTVLKDARWSTFAANMDVSKTTFAVAVGNGAKQVATSSTTPVAYASPVAAAAGGTAVRNHAQAINGGQITDNQGATLANTAANLSSLVFDFDTANTGQHNQLPSSSNLWGSNDSLNTNIAFGAAGDFWYLNGRDAPVLAANKWMLSGSELKFSAVPVPGAVWMFGTGLMAMLGLKRRKSMAV